MGVTGLNSFGHGSWKNASGIGILLVAIGASFWGVDGVIRQPLVDDISSTAIVLGEHLFLLLYALPILIASRGVFRSLTWRNWLALLVIAWGGSGLATVLFTEAFSHGNPTTVILLQKTQPLMVVFLAGFVLKERLPRIYWPLFGVAIVGAYLISFGSLDPFWELSSDQVTAAGLAVGASMLWGGSTVMGRFLLSKMSFSTLTAARFGFAVPFLFGLALFQGDVGATFTGISDQPWRIFLLALIPGLAAMLVYYQGLSRTQASYATLAELAFPATAVIVNWIFLDATITGTQIFGFALLWVAITLMSWIPTFRRTPSATTAEPALTRG